MRFIVQIRKACGMADNVIIHYDLVATIRQKQNIKITSNGVALYDIQGNKAAPLLPWTTVALRNTMAIANRIARTKSGKINNDLLVCGYP